MKDYNVDFTVMMAELKKAGASQKYITACTAVLDRVHGKKVRIVVSELPSGGMSLDDWKYYSDELGIEFIYD